MKYIIQKLVKTIVVYEIIHCKDSKLINSFNNLVKAKEFLRIVEVNPEDEFTIIPKKNE